MSTAAYHKPIKTRLFLVALVGGCHFLWALSVAIGWAQPIINFIFWMHFIKPIYLIEPFNIGTAVILVVVTAALGFVIGYIFAAIWNWVHSGS